MTAQFFDLRFDTQSDGTIRLTQRDVGDDCIIDMHPAQLAFIADAVSKSPRPAPTDEYAARIATLERRLFWLHDRFFETYAQLPDDFIERCSDAFEFHAWLEASCTVADELVADLSSTTTASPEAVTVATEAVTDASPPSTEPRTAALFD